MKSKKKNNNEENEYKQEESEYKFEPPKLPFKWFAATVVIPLLLATLPVLFSREDVPWYVVIIIGLSMFSILMILTCANVILQTYNEAFKRQVFMVRLDAKIKEVNDKEKLIYAHVTNVNEKSEQVTMQVYKIQGAEE